MHSYSNESFNIRYPNLQTHLLANSRELSLEGLAPDDNSVSGLKDRVNLAIDELADITGEVDIEVLLTKRDEYNEIILIKTEDEKVYSYNDKNTAKIIYYAHKCYDLDINYIEQVKKYTNTILLQLLDYEGSSALDTNLDNFAIFVSKIKEIVYHRGIDSIPNRLCDNLAFEEFISILKGDDLSYSSFINNIKEIITNIENFEVKKELNIAYDAIEPKLENLIAILEESIISIKLNLYIEAKMLLFTIGERLVDSDHDYVEITDNSLSLESFLYSTEDAKSAMASTGKDVGNIFKALASIPGKITETNRKFKMFRMKAKNHFFYKKYLGRIDHMYERYADEAQVKENHMIDDPVKILKESATDYISMVSDEFVALHAQLIEITRNLEKANDPKIALGIINKYLREFKGDLTKVNEIPNRILKATKDRVAQILLKGNHIYGYTRESIVAKKVPPANHTIVSLFTDNAHESPEMQPVSSIIKSVDSFKLIAANEKKPVFDLSMVTNNLVSKGVQAGDLKFLSKARGISMNLIKSAPKPEDPKAMGTDLGKKQVEAIWKGLKMALKYMVGLKGYIQELIGGYFVMMVRIDNLCKECVTALLYTERSHSDERFQNKSGTGFKSVGRNQHNEYKQTESEAYDDRKAQQLQNDEESKINFKRNMAVAKNDIRATMRRNFIHL
jgi:hypothetical protein